MISTQAGRLMAIETVLGTDARPLERFEIEEGINRLFTIQAQVRMGWARRTCSRTAHKDLTTKVLNDATARVDANQVGSVGANHSFEVARIQTQAIGGSCSLTVGAVGGAATAAR